MKKRDKVFGTGFIFITFEIASQPGALSAFALHIACYNPNIKISLFRPATYNKPEIKLPSLVSIEFTFFEPYEQSSSNLEYNEE